MRAVVLRGSTLSIDTVPDPEPGQGKVLVRTRACGICILSPPKLELYSTVIFASSSITS